MQVVTGRITGAAYIANHLTSCNNCARRNGCGRHVRIPCGQTSSIINQYLIAKTVVPAANQNSAAVGGQNRGPFWGGNVNASVSGIAKSVRLPKVSC